MKKLSLVLFAMTFVSLAASAQGVASDSAITANVKAQLATHSAFKAGQVAVTSTQGVVTLSGTVRSLAAKDEARDVAKRVSGVKSVNSNLEIVQVADGTILAEIKDKFSTTGVNKAARVSVTCIQGVVTLNGTANSPAAKDEAGDVAKKAEGVQRVVNNLQASQ